MIDRLTSKQYLQQTEKPKRNTRRGDVQRFYRDVVLRHEGDDCLKWPFNTTARGYGKMKVSGKDVIVSRAVCEGIHGPAPTPMHDAAHECGNGHLGCVTKRHLSWKTKSVNQADRVKHGTSNRGPQHGNSKLTKEDVISIRNSSGRHKEIADQFNISRQTVTKIKSGKAWSWL